MDGNAAPSLLSVVVGPMPIGLKGTADAVICTRSALRSQVPWVGLRVVFELKKEVASGYAACRNGI